MNNLTVNKVRNLPVVDPITKRSVKLPHWQIGYVVSIRNKDSICLRYADGTDCLDYDYFGEGDKPLGSTSEDITKYCNGTDSLESAIRATLQLHIPATMAMRYVLYKFEVRLPRFIPLPTNLDSKVLNITRMSSLNPFLARHHITLTEAQIYANFPSWIKHTSEYEKLHHPEDPGFLAFSDCTSGFFDDTDLFSDVI